jgi:hypothetical protein
MCSMGTLRCYKQALFQGQETNPYNLNLPSTEYENAKWEHSGGWYGKLSKVEY